MTTDGGAPAPEAPPLASLGGRRPAPEVIEDLRRLLELPPRARAAFWSVLGPALPDPIPDPVEGVIARFIEEHQVDPGAVTRALGGARALVRQAAALDAPPAAWASDLRLLGGGDTELERALAAGFERGKAMVRAELARTTLAEHGRLLEAVRFRLDRLTASDHAVGLEVPVVTLTLRYREGDKSDQISLQVTPELMAELRSVADRVLR